MTLDLENQIAHMIGHSIDGDYHIPQHLPADIIKLIARETVPAGYTEASEAMVVEVERLRDHLIACSYWRDKGGENNLSCRLCGFSGDDYYYGGSLSHSCAARDLDLIRETKEFFGQGSVTNNDIHKYIDRDILGLTAEDSK